MEYRKHMAAVMAVSTHFHSVADVLPLGALVHLVTDRQSMLRKVTSETKYHICDLNTFLCSPCPWYLMIIKTVTTS